MRWMTWRAVAVSARPCLIRRRGAVLDDNVRCLHARRSLDGDTGECGVDHRAGSVTRSRACLTTHHRGCVLVHGSSFVLDCVRPRGLHSFPFPANFELTVPISAQLKLTFSPRYPKLARGCVPKVLKLSFNVSDVFPKIIKLSIEVSECKPLA